MADDDNKQLAPAGGSGGVPATVGGAGGGAAGAAVASASAGDRAIPVNPYLAGFGTLSTGRQIALIVTAAVSMAMALWVVLWSQETDMRPLYNSLEHLDAAQVVDVLDANDIRYRIDQNTGMLLVESGRIHDARLRLAEAGMPGDRNVGFEMLQEEQALGTSQFMETARYRRSLEGELARTISSITSVKAARVHLAIPERSVFVRDQRKPSASVFLEVFAGRSVGEDQVRAIGNLVASSIPEMALQDVTIVDQKGALLSDFSEDASVAAANRQLEITERVEQQLVERIRRILSPVVGIGRFKSEVTADLDFTEVEQADEIFNPDLPALRSEQLLDEQRTGPAAATGVPGALTNQPPAAATAPEVAGAAAPADGAEPVVPSNTRNQATRNYELDRSISYTRHEVGRMRRLTVAVVLDNRRGTDPDSGEPVTEPWTDAELARIATLVRDAVGFDPARGDSVNVVNAPFVIEPEQQVEIEPIPFYQQPWFFPALRQAAGILFILVLVFVVLRPVLRNLSASAAEIRRIHEEERAARERAAREAAGGMDEDPLLKPPEDLEQKRRLAAVRTLIEEDSERVAQVVRKWVREG
jgi:flagellar M-ring protein FliF